MYGASDITRASFCRCWTTNSPRISIRHTLTRIDAPSGLGDAPRRHCSGQGALPRGLAPSLATHALQGSRIPVPPAQQLPHPGAEGVPVGGVGDAPVALLQVGKNAGGIDDGGELGASPTLALGARHRSVADGGTAHGAELGFSDV